MRSFGRDLAHALIDSQYITRGKRRILDLIGLALNLRASRLIIIQAKKGNPSKLDFYDIITKGTPLLGSLLISGVKLTREQKHTMRAPSRARLTIYYEDDIMPMELRKVTMFIPTLFDLEVSSSDEDRWVMKVAKFENLLEISFLDRETALSFGPIIRVRGIVLPST